MVRAESLPQRGCRSGCAEDRRPPRARQWGHLRTPDLLAARVALLIRAVASHL